jgi:hypothetical protein
MVTGNYHLQTATGMVHLIESEAVPSETLELLVDKQVKVTAVHTEGTERDRGAEQAPTVEDEIRDGYLLRSIGAESQLEARAYIFSGLPDPPPWVISSTNDIRQIGTALAGLKPSTNSISSQPPYLPCIHMSNQGHSGLPETMSVMVKLVRIESNDDVKWYHNDTNLIVAIQNTILGGLTLPGRTGPKDVMRFLESCTEAINKDALRQRLHEKEPQLYEAITVYGVNPSCTMLCLRTNEGGTYIFSNKTGKAERIVHAKRIGKGQVKKITYSKGAFVLWAGANRILTVGAAE